MAAKKKATGNGAAPGSVEITITTESDARAGVMVMAKHLPLKGSGKKKQGKTTVPMGTEIRLYYAFAGEPATPYTVKVDVPKGRKYNKKKNENPVKSRIPTFRHDGGGTMRFTVT